MSMVTEIEALASAALQPAPHPGTLPALVTGRLTGFLDGQPLVAIEGQAGARVARTLVDLGRADLGCTVIVAFESGVHEAMVILGRLRTAGTNAVSEGPRPAIDCDIDGRVVQIEASERLVLRCGDASITLTRAGKILVKGTYVSSHATGVNRVKGASVQIN